MKYEKSLPPDIRFGNGIRHVLPEILPPGPVLILCGKHALEQVRSEVVPALAGRDVLLAPPVSPELPLPEVAAAVSLARRADAVKKKEIIL